jgi:hypothetical protein
MVYSDQDGFPYDDWVAWEYVSYLWGHGEEPNEAGGECTTLYYEGCDDEVDLEQLAALVEDGTIVDETMVYSDQDGFPFEGWTAWEECSYLFGMGSERCTALYYEGCDDEVDLEQLAALVEDGTITALTLVYSDQPAFPFEGWTAWEECSYLFGVGEAPEGGCTTLVYEVCLPPSRRPPAPRQPVGAEAGGWGDESSGHRIEALLGRRARHTPANARGVDIHGAPMRLTCVGDRAGRRRSLG